MLTRFTVVIIFQYIQILNHYVVIIMLYTSNWYNVIHRDQDDAGDTLETSAKPVY